MTVKELKEILTDFEDYHEVVVCGENMIAIGGDAKDNDIVREIMIIKL